ncbi:MAG: glycosyltransferase WbsX family protein [Fusobacteriaceae bacterium]
MKIIAYYLPQFHEVEENNTWWGKGFTEWTNTRKTKPLYKGHNQPKEPLNDNYYNLLDKETMEWQQKISTENGVYGFCYYHYWFKGKKLLEKPIENLLKWKDINQKFCFCWANHDWKKTWNGTQEMLMKQEYGIQKDWESHFNYLLQFFKDERYIKINNKPIFMLYRAKDILNCEEMINFWNNLATKNGFSGIYIIESLNLKNEKSYLKNSKAVALREPNYSMINLNIAQKFINKIKREYFSEPSKYNYSNLCKSSIKLLEKIEISNKAVFFGSFVGWDNTPRHSIRGRIAENSTPEEFKKYISQQIRISKTKKIEEQIIFLNAWNEWAEGMYLEPDKRFKYGFLNALKEALEENKEEEIK